MGNKKVNEIQSYLNLYSKNIISDYSKKYYLEKVNEMQSTKLS